MDMTATKLAHELRKRGFKATGAKRITQSNHPRDLDLIEVLADDYLNLASGIPCLYFQTDPRNGRYADQAYWGEEYCKAGMKVAAALNEFGYCGWSPVRVHKAIDGRLFISHSQGAMYVSPLS